MAKHCRHRRDEFPPVWMLPIHCAIGMAAQSVRHSRRMVYPVRDLSAAAMNNAYGFFAVRMTSSVSFSDIRARYSIKLLGP